MTTIPRSSRLRTVLTTLAAFVILFPALYGFGGKLLEFIKLTGADEGTFALMPLLNYLLTSAGFLLLFLWAMMHGMFRDTEYPKYTMLEREQMLDREEAEQHARATQHKEVA